MGKIYQTQDYLRVKLSYTAEGVAENVTSVKIKYIDPDGTVGEFNATHVPASKYAYYDIPLDGELLIVGGWRFWLFLTMNDGRVLPGEVWEQDITEEGIE